MAAFVLLLHAFERCATSRSQVSPGASDGTAIGSTEHLLCPTATLNYQVSQALDSMQTGRFEHKSP